MSEIETMIDNLVRECIDYGSDRDGYYYYSTIEKQRDQLLKLIKSKLDEEGK